MSISTSIANDKLAELRNKRKLAIQSLNFDAAEKYDRLIKEKQEQVISDRISKIYSEITKDLRAHIDMYGGINGNISEFDTKTTSQIHKNYQDIIDRMEIQHEKERRNVDDSHGVALMREAEREVPEQIDLLEKAKAAAVDGNYTQAKELRDEARRVGEFELESRKQRIDEEFDQARSLLATKQQESIQAIQAKCDDEINQHGVVVQTRREETRQRFDDGIQLIRQRAEIRCKALVAEDEALKDDALRTLNQKIDEILENNRRKTQSATASAPPEEA